MAMMMFTRRTPNTWQDTLDKKRTNQCASINRLAKKVAKRHLKEATAFIIDQRLRCNQTIAACYVGSFGTYYGLRLYAGTNMEELNNLHNAASCEFYGIEEFLNSSKGDAYALVKAKELNFCLPKRYHKYCHKALHEFESTYRETINAGLGIKIVGDHCSLYPTEIKEKDEYEE